MYHGLGPVACSNSELITKHSIPYIFSRLLGLEGGGGSYHHMTSTYKDDTVWKLQT